MLCALWTAKGGSGCSVTTSLFALQLLREGRQVVLVDFGRDQSAVLGCPSPAGPTLAELVRLGPGASPNIIDDVAVEVTAGLRLIEAGDPIPGTEDALLRLLTGLGDQVVVVDVGLIGSIAHAWAVPIAATATVSLLVTRPCYLALRGAATLPVRPSGVVVIGEPWRALCEGDIEQAIGAPVRANVAHDPAIARAVDAGLVTARVPRGAMAALKALVPGSEPAAAEVA